MKKILFVTLSNLGDVVLTLPTLQALLGAYPEAKMDVIVGQGASPILEKDSRIAKLISYNKKMSWREKIHFIQGIRRENYDLIIDLKYSLIGLFGGAKIRNHYFKFIKKTVHRRLAHLEALRGIVSTEEPEKSFLKIDSGYETRFSHFFNSGRVVLAAVGSKSDIKKWPAESYAALLDRLASTSHPKIILVGDKSDCLDAEKVKSLMQSPVEDLTGKTQTRDLCYLLKNASLLITNDSAPLHIADSLKTPVLAIFGPTDPRKYGPRTPYSLAIRKPLFCSPCENAQCRYEHECMRYLTVDEVHQKAMQILNDEFQPRNLKILVVRLDRIGDLLLSLPAIAAIKKRFPNATLSMIVRPATAAIVRGHPLVDEVIPYSYEKKGAHSFPVGYLRFIREIISRNFDIAFILNPSVRAHLLPYLAGIPYRIGFNSDSPFLLTKKVPDRRHDGLKHESEYTLDIVRAFGIQDAVVTHPKMPFFTEHERRVDAFLSDSHGNLSTNRLIAIHPGASCPSKRWPIESYLDLSKRIIEENMARVLFIGGDEEKPLGEYLVKNTKGTIDLTGKMDLKTLAALLSRCEVLVSNDSGPVHVASAVGTRTLCIFGRNKAGLSPVRWKALGDGHRVLQKDVGCVVCLAHQCTIDFECLRAVSVEEVFLNLQSMLSEKKYA